MSSHNQSMSTDKRNLENRIPSHPFLSTLDLFISSSSIEPSVAKKLSPFVTNCFSACFASFCVFFFFISNFSSPSLCQLLFYWAHRFQYRSNPLMSSRQESKWMPLDKSLLSSICPKSLSKRKEFAAYMMGIPFPLSNSTHIVSPPPLCVRSSTVPSVLVFIVSLSTTSRRRTVFPLHTSAISRWTCEGLADNRLRSLRWCCWWFGRQSFRYCYGSYGGWWLAAQGVPS